MDSIEERVKKVFIHCYDGLDERQSAYVQGAYEQKEIDIDMACKVLKEELSLYRTLHDESLALVDVADFVERFKIELKGE